MPGAPARRPAGLTHSLSQHHANGIPRLPAALGQTL